MTKEAGFSGFTNVQTIRDRTISHADFLFISIKVNSGSKDQFSFKVSVLKEEDLVSFDHATPRLSSARSRTKRFALHTLTRSN